MEFGHTPDEIDFRDWVCDTLAAPPIRAALDALHASAEPDPDERRLYRLLGAAGLLAAGWPEEYGGLGRSPAHAAIAVEEMMRAGVPDTLYVNGIQTVGQLLFLVGDQRQRRAILPGLAAGERFASVLYTEPGAGSDLGAVRCVATGGPDKFRLSGTKVFNLKGGRTDLGLCVARRPGDHAKYDGISLFLIDMRAPGVRIERLPSLPDEQFHLVTLDEVTATADDVVGRVGDGWAALTRALPLERTGFDFAMRAERWYRCGTGGDAGEVDTAAWDEHSGRFGAQVRAARLLAWKATTEVAAGGSAR